VASPTQKIAQYFNITTEYDFDTDFFVPPSPKKKVSKFAKRSQIEIKKANSNLFNTQINYQEFKRRKSLERVVSTKLKTKIEKIKSLSRRKIPASSKLKVGFSRPKFSYDNEVRTKAVRAKTANKLRNKNKYFMSAISQNVISPASRNNFQEKVVFNQTSIVNKREDDFDYTSSNLDLRRPKITIDHSEFISDNIRPMTTT
jgi:hypothetical protein